LRRRANPMPMAPTVPARNARPPKEDVSFTVETEPPAARRCSSRSHRLRRRCCRPRRRCRPHPRCQPHRAASLTCATGLARAASLGQRCQPHHRRCQLLRSNRQPRRRCPASLPLPSARACVCHVTKGRVATNARVTSLVFMVGVSLNRWESLVALELFRTDKCEGGTSHVHLPRSGWAALALLDGTAEAEPGRRTGWAGASLRGLRPGR